MEYYLKEKLWELNEKDWERFRKEGLIFLHGVDEDYHPVILFRSFKLWPKTWELADFQRSTLAVLERAASLAD